MTAAKRQEIIGAAVDRISDRMQRAVYVKLAPGRQQACYATVEMNTVGHAKEYETASSYNHIAIIILTVFQQIKMFIKVQFVKRFCC